MNCRKWEEEIALYAGGDLPDARMADVERHLAECAGCRALAEELRAGQTILAELGAEALDDAMVALVRQRVMARVAEPRRAPVYWRWALVAALVAVAILVWPRHHRTAAPQIVASVHSVPALAGGAPAAGHGPAPRLHTRQRHHAPIGPREPLLVQLVTRDPNIVIYWIVDQKPEGD